MEARQHTDRHYDAELKELNLKILEMGGLVEKQIEHAISGLVERKDDICLRLLALHQPAAKDLRLITTGLKITTDLERIGDIAVNICERALELNKEPQLKPFIDIPRMAQIAQTMLRQSLDAFVHENVDLALSVCRDDDAIDQLTEQLFRELISYMVEAPQTTTRAIRLLFIAKYLERIADHATNIAEMIVFTVKGKSIRHLDEVPGSV